MTLTRVFTVVLALAWLAVPGSAAPPQSPDDAFAFFQPAVRLTAADMQTLDRGQAVVRVLPAKGTEAAVFTAVAINIAPEHFAAWMRNIVALKKNPAVLAVGRFSRTPCLEDLRDLTIDDRDLTDISNCRPGDCKVKLAAEEMVQLRRTIAGRPEQWKPAMQQEFRRVILQRVQDYLAAGHTPRTVYQDDDPPVSLAQTFSALVQRSAYLGNKIPQFAAYLDRYPRAPMPEVESFLYWSKELFAGKSQVSVTHLSLLRLDGPGLPLALAAGKQVFATHYLNGSLSLTALLRGPSPSQNYLAYLNRSDVDMLTGFFGPLIRSVMSHRLSSEAPEILQTLRRRLESSVPAEAITGPVRR